jgi:hypothetical protein
LGVRVGDEVLSRNMASGKLEYKRVVALARPHVDKLLELRVEGEAAPLRATPVHPFWVRRGNNIAAWVEAAELQPGDLILTDSGKWNRVTSVSRLQGEQTVYNFEVADDHDYFVDKPGLLVHNVGPCAPGLPPEVANTFADGQYTTTTLAQDTTVYRVEGPGQTYGGWYGTVAPSSPQEADAMYNVTSTNPANTMTNLSTYNVPTGTTVYQGPVAGGTRTQWYIPNALASGVQLINTIPFGP